MPYKNVETEGRLSGDTFCNKDAIEEKPLESDHKLTGLENSWCHDKSIGRIGRYFAIYRIYFIRRLKLRNDL